MFARATQLLLYIILHHIASYCITLHHLASYCITYNIASYCVTSHHIVVLFVLHHIVLYIILHHVASQQCIMLHLISSYYSAIHHGVPRVCGEERALQVHHSTTPLWCGILSPHLVLMIVKMSDVRGHKRARMTVETRSRFCSALCIDTQKTRGRVGSFSLVPPARAQELRC